MLALACALRIADLNICEMKNIRRSVEVETGIN
jgi:hypothetical protein